MKTANFLYDLPSEAIAQHPVEPRHASRLLDARDFSDHRFLELPHLLAPGDLVVVNTSRVRAGRLIGHKADTGGVVEVLVLGPVEEPRWEVMLRPARRLRAGARIEFAHFSCELESDPTEGRAIVRIEEQAGQSAEELIEHDGQVPIPPYIHQALDDPERYQTVYADRLGSAAAPTAGLHFTQQILDALDTRGIEVAKVDLQVGLDTFRPIATDEIDSHRLHSERYDLPPETATKIDEVRKRSGRVIAIGTTVVRALEASATDNGRVVPGFGATDLFITPGFEFKVVDALVTNFHLPGSTLIVLVATFLGETWRRVYETALERGYRFLSFGDAMYAQRRSG